MTANTNDFTTIAADFLRLHVLALLREGMPDAAGANDPRAPLRAGVMAWIADLESGRAAAALSPDSLAGALEAAWLLGVAGVIPEQKSGSRFVDIVMRRDLSRAVDLALAATEALDLLRGTSVAQRFRKRQLALIDVMIGAADSAMSGVCGNA